MGVVLGDSLTGDTRFPRLAAAYPDIAVLDVAPLTGHPCVAVDAQRPQQEDQFQAYGYPREGGAIRLTPARLAYRGLHGTAPTVYLDLASDTVQPGMQRGGRAKPSDGPGVRGDRG